MAKTEPNKNEQALMGAMSKEYEHVETVAARLFGEEADTEKGKKKAIRFVRNNLRWTVKNGFIEKDPDRRGFYRLPLEVGRHEEAPPPAEVVHHPAPPVEHVTIKAKVVDKSGEVDKSKEGRTGGPPKRPKPVPLMGF